MHILRSWYDSLSLLFPSQISLFGLVSLLSTYKTWQVLARTWVFWAAIVAMSVWGYFDQTMIQPYWCLAFSTGFECIFKRFVWHFCAFLVAMVLVLVAAAATRPSVGLKDASYFNNIIGHMISILGVIIVLQCIGYTCMALSNIWITNTASALLVTSWQKTYSLWYVLFAFFGFDTDGTLSSILIVIRRMIVMVLYNLPLVAIVNFFIHALEWCVYYVLMYLGLDTHFFIAFIVWLIAMPLIVNIWANIYIKKLHEHPDLYFVSPK